MGAIPIITLTTDFGACDGYAAAMKGVILGVSPQATLVDVSHEIAPQDIRSAAFLLSTVWRFFPMNTVHVVVVDPGVGSGRPGIALCLPSACFVAPDNGVLGYVIEDAFPSKDNSAAIDSARRLLPPEAKAVVLSNARYWRHPVSNTFHGRDIFAPVAAHLSLGVPLSELGEPLSSLRVFPIPSPQPLPNGSLSGKVIHIDHFGDLITNIKQSDLPDGKLTIEIGGREIAGLSRSYQEGNELLGIIGGSGRLEIAAKNGSAAKMLGVGVDAAVNVSLS